jgi:ATP-dependent DNA ligase
VNGGLYVEKTDNFPHLAKVQWPNLHDTIIDGEIIVRGDGTKSWDVTSITGGLPDTALKFQEKHGFVDYVIFDILYYKGVDVRGELLGRRSAMLKIIYEEELQKNKHIKMIRFVNENKRRFYEEIVVKGGEGIILKNSMSKYGVLTAWAKVKKEAKFDVFITGYLPPEQVSTKVSGKTSITRYADKGWIGSITIGQYNVDGTERNCGSVSGMDEHVRALLSTHQDKYIGRVVEISAQERIASGFFRHPRFERFRDDKGACDCVYRPDES